jgi:glyoxylase-like metal-dependent hydrolase (beta-lactamase superfamily II)
MVESAPGHPDVLLVRASNPGPMTLTGTNTYVVGSDPCYVIDPGPDDAAHLAAVRAAARERGGCAGVVLTHSHADHSAGVAALDFPLLWGQVSAGEEGSWLPSSASVPDPPERVGPLAVVSTPGHAPDHVAYVLDDVCFCGDLILGEGSSIVPPAAFGGSLAGYLASLDLVEGLGVPLLAPGHGPWIEDPSERIAGYREHRLERERRLAAALDSGERSREAILDQVWDDVPAMLRPAAMLAMQAHLEKLEAEGRLPADLTD